MHSHTRPANTLTSAGLYVEIIASKGMPALAVGLIATGSAHAFKVAAPRILARSDRLEMVRINAGRHPTKVVKL
jgi:hypothetical protein